MMMSPHGTGGNGDWLIDANSSLFYFLKISENNFQDDQLEVRMEVREQMKTR